MGRGVLVIVCRERRIILLGNIILFGVWRGRGCWLVDGLVILAVSRNSFNNNLNYYFDLHLMGLLIHCLVLQDFLTPYLLFLFFSAKDGV